MLVGEAHLGSGHGKGWTDNTTNSLNLSLKSVAGAAPVLRNLDGTKLRVVMTPRGNNKWRFNLDVYAVLGGTTYHKTHSGNELNGRDAPVSKEFQY